MGTRRQKGLDDFRSEAAKKKHTCCISCTCVRKCRKAIYQLLFSEIETNIFLLWFKQHMCFIMKSLLNQLKNRRIKLGLKQHDMLLRVGISRQQYQRLESKGNPRLDTLELIAKGLNSEILLIPQEKLQAVKAVLEGKTVGGATVKGAGTVQEKRLSDDPWKDMLGDDE